MKKYYDRHHRESIPYKPGDHVMLEGTFIRTDQPMKKLGDKRYGPFVIDHKVGSSAYWLRLPATWRKVYPVFNEALLTPYREAQFPSQQQEPPPPPVIIDEAPEYIMGAEGRCESTVVDRTHH